MCLDRISKKRFKIKKENGKYVGWKIFDHDCSYHLHFRHQGNMRRVPVGKWLDEEDYREYPEKSRIFISGNAYYNTGFHIYLDQPTWESSSIRKVYFKNIIVNGMEGTKCRVLVAKNIFVVPKKG